MTNWIEQRSDEILAFRFAKEMNNTPRRWAEVIIVTHPFRFVRVKVGILDGDKKETAFLIRHYYKDEQVTGINYYDSYQL